MSSWIDFLESKTNQHDLMLLYEAVLEHLPAHPICFLLESIVVPTPKTNWVQTCKVIQEWCIESGQSNHLDRIISASLNALK